MIQNSTPLSFTTSVSKTLKRFMLMLMLIAGSFISQKAFAHVFEIRVIQAQDGTLTWYLQSYHAATECTGSAAGININGTQFPISSVVTGDARSIANTSLFAQDLNCLGIDRRNSYISYAIVRTPYLGTALTVTPYSSAVCFDFCVGGSGNFNPPPPPVCTSCPITGWSSVMAASGNNNLTPCFPNDDKTTATIQVSHLACANITGDKQFSVVYDPGGANVTYGPFNYNAGIQTDVVINLPYGASNSTQVKVIDSDFPCEITHGLVLPGGAYLGEKETVPPSITCPGASSIASCLLTIPNYTTSAVVTDNCTPAAAINITQSPAAGTAIAPGATVQVTLTATDASGNTATCSFNVNRPNITPVAVTDAATVCATKSVIINVLGNDSHPQGSPLTISDFTQPATGTLVKNADNTFTYTAAPNTSGPITFSYTIKANDGVIPFSENNHYYEFVPASQITWANAKAAANLRTYNGLRGYLVTVTSATEQAFVLTKLLGQGWMGASDLAKEGDWRWVTGPEGLEEAGQGRYFSNQFKNPSQFGNCSAGTGVGQNGNYVNWGGAEPNDCGANLNEFPATDVNRPGEHYAHFIGGTGRWNDYPNNAGVNIQGYVVEYGGLENCTPVLTATATVVVNVNALPNVNITGNNTVCAGSSITLTANGASTYSWSPAAGLSAVTGTAVSASPANNTAYTVTGTDAKGCVNTSAPFPVTVNTLPAISCQQNITVGALPGACGANVNFGATATGTPTPNISYMTSTGATTSGSFFRVGTTVVTATATNSCGSVTCQFSVIVRDVEPPVPNVGTLPNVVAECSVNVQPPSATDNCSSQVSGVTTDPTFFNTQGTYFIQWKYTDEHGNFTTQTQTVIIKDVTPPVIACAFNVTVNADLNACGAVVNYNKPTASDNCGNGNLPTSIPGFTYKGTFGGHTYFLSDILTTPEDAHARAIAAGGHLASINSAAENALISAMDPGYIWIGFTDRAVEGQFKWVTNEPVNYTNWAAGEPNNAGDEDWAVINWGTDKWNDWYFTAAAKFVVEFEGGTIPTTLSSGRGSGALFPIGTTTETWKATDAGGNTTFCSFTVTVVDNQAPVITCPPSVIVKACDFNIPNVTTGLVVSDNCPGVIVSQFPAAGTPIQAGSTVAVTITARDASGNVSTCVVSITKRALLQAPFTISEPKCAGGSDGSIIINGVGGAGGYQYSINGGASFQSGNQFNNLSAGNYTVTVKDAEGCLSPAVSFVMNQPKVVSFTVNQGPVSCNGSNNGFIALNATGGSSVNSNFNYAWNAPTDFDNAENSFPEVLNVSKFALSGGGFAHSHSGAVTITIELFNAVSSTWQLVYTRNLASGEQFNLAGINTTFPTIPKVTGIRFSSAPSQFQTYHSVTGLNVNLGSNNYSYSKDGGTTFQPGSTFNGLFAGTYIIVVKDINNCVSAPQTVTITQPDPLMVTIPSIMNVTCPGGNNGAINTNVTGGNPPYTYSWSNGANSPSLSGLTVGTYTVTVRDSKNCFATTTMTINQVDPIFPTVITKNITVQLDALGQAFINPNSIDDGSFDNCIIVTRNININRFTCANVGNPVIVTLAVRDNSGNVSFGTAVVTVEDNLPPVVHTKAVILVLDATGHAVLTPAQINNNSTDNCGIASYEINKKIFDCSDVGHPVSVELTVTDVHGNVSRMLQNITVLDNTNPTITSAPDQTQTADRGDCGANVTVVAPATTDICAVASVVNNYNNTADASGHYPVGTTTITWTVTDIHGNTNTSTQTITVTDNEAPIVTQPVNISVNNDAGKCGAIVTIAEPANSDNCAVASVTNTKLPNDFYPVGTTTVSWTVTDIHGNATTVTHTVTVADNEAPIANCKPITVTLVNGGASITVADVNDNSTDNCGIQSVTISKSTFNCSNLGANSVTLTVTDIHGNVSTCTAIVTVVGVLPTCSIASVPTNTTYTGGIPTNLYLGYGAQSTTLKVTPTSGTSFTYSWSGAATSMLSSTTSGAPVFTPTTAGVYTFTVVTTNNFGCTSTCTITLCVKDIRVPGTNGSKVYVCHVPPGNPGNANTLSISVNAVSSHLGQHDGDKLGTCDQVCAAPVTTRTITTEPTTETTVKPPVTTDALSVKVDQKGVPGTFAELRVAVRPNPTTTTFVIHVETSSKEPVSIRIADALGRIHETKTGIIGNSDVTMGGGLNHGAYFIEVMQGKNKQVVKAIKLK
jgi:hypothetical protein